MSPASPGPPSVCGIILHPSGHTLSPVLHRAAYAQLGIDASYHVFDVRSDAFADAIVGMRALGLRQLSVSLPHKEAALELADRASDEARAIGAANTLTRRGDEIVADNTDWLGALRTLELLGTWGGARAVVMGAGGVARAVVYALRRLEMQVVVVNRTRERAERVAADLGATAGELGEDYDLLVNATSLGMDPDVGTTSVAESRLAPKALIFDTVYRPLETRLLREARARGCRVQDGLDMLVHQAVEQVRLWSGRAPDADALRQSVSEL